MKKLLLSACLLSALATPAFASQHISVTGSTSVTEVMDVLAEVYHKEHKDVVIDVNGIGSSAGIKDAQAGIADLGMSSRDLTPSEKKMGLVEHVIAKDGIAVVVNPSNKLNDLTTTQVKDIFNGSVTNWQTLGGLKSPIVVASRENGSGTRGAFEELMHLTRVINKVTVSTVTPHAQIASSNGIEKTIVASNTHAIGFISLGSLDNSVTPVKIHGVEPTVANVINGTYSISRPFILLNKPNTLSKPASDFVNWIESKEGQDIIKQRGYISVS